MASNNTRSLASLIPLKLLMSYADAACASAGTATGAAAAAARATATAAAATSAMIGAVRRYGLPSQQQQQHEALKAQHQRSTSVHIFWTRGLAGSCTRSRSWSTAFATVWLLCGCHMRATVSLSTCCVGLPGG